MNKVEGREVTRAELINSVFVPGIGNLDSGKFTTGVVGSPVLSMTVEGNFVLAKIVGAGKKVFEVAVPMTNIKGIELSTDVKPLPKPALKE